MYTRFIFSVGGSAPGNESGNYDYTPECWVIRLDDSMVRSFLGDTHPAPIVSGTILSYFERAYYGLDINVIEFNAEFWLTNDLDVVRETTDAEATAIAYLFDLAYARNCEFADNVCARIREDRDEREFDKARMDAGID